MFKQTHNRSINFTRCLRLFIVAAGVAATMWATHQLNLFRTSRTAFAAGGGNVALTMRGQEAIKYLKKEGTYNSLAAAMTAVLAQQTKLTAAGGAAQDLFGSVAVSGNTVAVGAFLADGPAANQGAVYVFLRNGSGWAQQARLIAADGAANDRLGGQVALNGDTLIVGANVADVGGREDQGAAYIFVRSGAAWTQQAKLVAADGAAFDQFGASVSLSGDTAVVGAVTADINGNFDQGAAYVFVRNGTTWNQQAKLVAADGAANDDFGEAVAINGDTVAVGAFTADANRGAAYVFTRSGAAWTQQQKLTANDGAAYDYFGQQIALGGDTMIIGAPGADIGANTDQGAAYVFTRSGATWNLQQKLTAAAGASDDRFGQAVALSGDTAAIGAPFDDIAANQNQGSVRVFLRSGTSWSERAKLEADDGATGDNFGNSVAASDDLVLAGARLDDIGANQNQGSAYVFVVCGDLAQPQKLIADDGMAGDNFGYSVAISGNTLVVGAYKNDGSQRPDRGSAYVFVRNGGGWSLQQKLSPDDGGEANDNFGYAVAISGDTVAVGAPNVEVEGYAKLGAVYVFVRNGTTWTQRQMLPGPASNLTEEFFGSAVSLSGDTIAVGAYGDGPNFPGLSGTKQGAVFIYVRTGSVWAFQQSLRASDGALGDQFGFAVSLNGNTVLVGAPLVRVPNLYQGAAYVFVRSGTTWTQQQKLAAGDGAAFHVFGNSVALSGDTAVVGARGADAAYVFTHNGTNWSQQAKLTPGDGATNISFGYAVAVTNDTAVVGAHFATIGANAQQGAAYVFARSGYSWSQQQKLAAADGVEYSQFGNSVAVGGDTILVGVSLDTVGGNAQRGSVYAYGCAGCPAITLTPAALSNGAVGTSYNQVITASGGTAPYNFSLSGGSLPPGLTLSTDGMLSGAPTTAGTYSFAITATMASLCSGGRDYTLTIAPPCQTLTVSPATLPSGTAGIMYNLTLIATGGASPYSFAVSAGTLPNGMTLSAAGVLSGAPTASGTFDFTVAATDASGCQGARAYALQINLSCQATTVNPPSLPNGTVGTAYNQTITATGGNAPYTFAVNSGSLPNGLSLSSAGVLSGTPTTTGIFTFTIKATYGDGCPGTRSYALTINGGNNPNGLQFYPLTHPVRLLDTRPGQTGCDAPGAQITGGGARTQTAAGRTCDGLTIPANARALTGNITTVQSGGGYLTLYPSDAQQPLVANSNYNPNEILNNVFTVGLGAGDGAFKIFVTSNTHVVVDVTGYYAPPAAGGLYFHPLPRPIRLLETRAGFTGCNAPGQAIPGGADTPQQGRLTCDGVTIPTTAQALVGNATVVNPGGGYLTLYPSGGARPLAASSNYAAGQVLNAPFTVGLGADGNFMVFATTTTDLVVDVLGYYSTEVSDANGAGLLFNPLPTPVRLLETRAGLTGCYTPGAPLLAGSTRTQQARGVCGGATIAAGALAVVGNATVVNDQAGYLTFWPDGAAQPLVATTNFAAGQILNRHFTVGLGGDGAFKIFASAQTDLVVDLSGYFAP